MNMDITVSHPNEPQPADDNNSVQPRFSWDRAYLADLRAALAELDSKSPPVEQLDTEAGVADHLEHLDAVRP